MFLNFLTLDIKSWFMILVWIVVIIITIYIEANTAQMVSIWLTLSAVAPIILAACGVDIIIQLVVFAVSSIILLIITRPFVKKLSKQNTTKTNVDELVGEIVIVTKDIPVDGKGEIKAKYDYYTAISSEPNCEFVKNTKVKIKEVNGNKVVVEKY